jgi:hypothetical protein
MAWKRKLADFQMRKPPSWSGSGLYAYGLPNEAVCSLESEATRRDVMI